MHNAPRRAHVRIPEREALLPEDWTPDTMNPAHKAKDDRAIAFIQGCNDGDMFGQVTAVPGVTLNGQPVKLLVVGSRGQAKDLLDHEELVTSVGQLDNPNRKPRIDLGGLIHRQLVGRSVKAD